MQSAINTKLLGSISLINFLITTDFQNAYGTKSWLFMVSLVSSSISMGTGLSDYRVDHCKFCKVLFGNNCR